MIEYQYVGLPNHFDHVLLGELPPFNNQKKYIGRRFFLKPDRFGFERTKVSAVLMDVKGFIKKLVRQQFCRLVKGETIEECAKLRVFKQNIDRKVLKKWKKVLSNLPSKWKIDKSYRERAFKYGIHEIDQQSRDLKSAGAGRAVQKFRTYLQKRYGLEDISVRKGREIIFTVDDLRESHGTCQTPSDKKC